MSLFKSIKNIASQFTVNKGYEAVAARLQSGEQAVHMTASRKGDHIFFIGTGEYIEGQGNKTIYDVSHFTLGSYDFTSPVNTHTNVWAMGELENDHFQEVHAPTRNVDKDLLIAKIKNIASKLKPGFGYSLGSWAFTNDVIGKGGFNLIRRGFAEIFVPENIIHLPPFFDDAFINEDYTEYKTFIYDQSKVKRQHRELTDIKRWIELAQVPSVEDNWAIKFTHKHTAGAPVFYYALNIDIDLKSMAGHPFYLNGLFRGAIDMLGEKHRLEKFWIEVDVGEARISYDGKSSTVTSYLRNQSQRRVSVDTMPVLIDDGVHIVQGDGYIKPYLQVITTDEHEQHVKATR